MTDDSTTGIKLYDKFHAQSLERHFSIKMKSLSELAQYSNFLEYLEDFKLTREILNQIKAQRQIYEFEKAPKEKLIRLFHFLEKIKFTPMTFLDFGSGNGNCLRIIKRKYSSSTVVGVDTSIDSLNENSDIKIYKKISDLSGAKFDVILLIHTLHHLDLSYQQNTLQGLKELMGQNSLLFIYEDTWTDINTSNDKDVDTMNAQFLRLSQSEKKELFKANDFWSNTWFYQRNFDSTNVFHKSIEQLQQDLNALGFNIIDSGTDGFNFERIHGVPSGWLLAEKDISA